MKSSGNSRLPEGWSETRVAEVIAHYETQSEDEAVAEDEAALSEPDGHGDSDRLGAGGAGVAGERRYLCVCIAVGH